MNAALDICMIDDHIVAFGPNGGSGMAFQLFEQSILETIPGDAQMLELVSFDQAAGPVMFKHQPVAAHYIATSCVLGWIESIFDQLKYHIVARQREHEHHHSRHALCDRKFVGGVA